MILSPHPFTIVLNSGWSPPTPEARPPTPHCKKKTAKMKAFGVAAALSTTKTSNVEIVACSWISFIFCSPSATTSPTERYHKQAHMALLHYTTFQVIKNTPWENEMVSSVVAVWLQPTAAQLTRRHTSTNRRLFVNSL